MGRPHYRSVLLLTLYMIERVNTIAIKGSIRAVAKSLDRTRFLYAANAEHTESTVPSVILRKSSVSSAKSVYREYEIRTLHKPWLLPTAILSVNVE